MATAEARTTVTTDRIDLVNEDDAGRLLLGLVEHVAHARCTDTYEHLNEVGTGDREKRDLGFACNGLRQQRFTRSWRADHQHAARNAPAEPLELAWIAQELNEFMHVVLRFIDTGHIGKRGLDLVVRKQPGLALAKCHRATAPAGAALHLAHEQHEHRDDDEDREAGDQQLHPDALLFRQFGAELHLMRGKVIDELRIIHRGPIRDELTTGRPLATDHRALKRHLGDLLVTNSRQKLRIAEFIGLRLRAEVGEHCHQNRGND